MSTLNLFDILKVNKIAAIPLIIALLSWSIGLPLWIQTAQAASLTNVKDTISDSNIGATANHVINYTSTNAAIAGETIDITFDPGGNAFTGVSTLVAADVSGVGMTVVAACGAGTDEVTISPTDDPDSVTLTVCPGDTVPAGAITVTIGGDKVTNPGSAGSYVVRIAGTQTDSADTRIAIIGNVTVTAAVDTIFIFTISGVGSGLPVNGDAVNTSAVSTATTLPFGTLAPGTAKVLAQDLTVTTNATNGFSVTVHENQNLTSATGADIDLFQDGGATAAPIVWTSPAGTLGSEDTYGHIGVTSEDADLNADEFGIALYAGNIATPRVIFSHNGPSDGSAPNIGATRIGYKMEIDGLQEAGNDYTNILTYIATPTF